MKLIGITGKQGSGKSTVASLLAEKLQCTYIDVDSIGHMATADADITQKLCEVFGNTILGQDGNIDRKQLGNIVFASKEKMDILTTFTWDYMQRVLDDLLEKAQTDCMVLDWALLPNSKYWKKCDYTIVVTAEDAVRKRKVMERDAISEEYFEKREASSIDYSTISFDYLLQNDYQKETIPIIVDKLSKHLQRKV